MTENKGEHAEVIILDEHGEISEWVWEKITEFLSRQHGSTVILQNGDTLTYTKAGDNEIPF